MIFTSERDVTKSKGLAGLLQVGIAAASAAAVWALWTQDAESELWFRVLLSLWLLALPAYMWWSERSVERLREKIGKDVSADRSA